MSRLSCWQVAIKEGIASSVYAYYSRLRCGVIFWPIAVLVFCLWGIVLPACSSLSESKAEPVVIMAITTSLADSGLMDEITKQFKAQPRGYTVKIVAVGSGQALAMARKGEVDIVITHDPKAEEVFLAERKKSLRFPLMTSRFVLLGPDGDPANVAGAGNAVEAFRRIAAAGALFVSRGDKSGTHSLEMAIWQEADIVPNSLWYKESGSGMGASLRLADERGAYVLTDVPTYVMNRSTLRLKIVLDHDPALINPYSILVVDAAASQAEATNAIEYSRFLLSDRIRDLIGRYGIDRFGEHLFLLPRSSSEPLHQEPSVQPDSAR